MARHIITIFLAMLYYTTTYSYPTPVDFSGELVRWDIDINSPPITYEIIGPERYLSEYQGYVELSFEMWNEVKTSYLTLTPKGDNEEAQITIKLTSSSTGDFSAGFSTFDEVDSKTGAPIHCKVEITVGSSVGYNSFSKTALHEIGHCIGLGHSLIPESIMSYETDKNEFALDIDDIAAVSRLYPIDGSKPKLPPGCAINQDIKHKKLSIIFFFFMPIILSILTYKKKII